MSWCFCAHSSRPASAGSSRPKLREQAQAFELVGQRFRVLEGQVDELPLHAGQAQVVAAGHQRARRGQRLRIAGKHAGACRAACCA